ncbi:MAG TPA: hypothetical protein VIM71_08555 [Lacunisphaera sp.]
MPTNPKKLQITLNVDDAGQLLDGLRLRAEVWAKTADYLDSGFTSEDAFICEECTDPHEARCIAQHYERIITQIEHQIERQGGLA